MCIKYETKTRNKNGRLAGAYLYMYNVRRRRLRESSTSSMNERTKNTGLEPLEGTVVVKIRRFYVRARDNPIKLPLPRYHRVKLYT